MNSLRRTMYTPARKRRDLVIESPTAKNLPVLGELINGLVMGGAENLAVQLANAHAQAGGESHLIVIKKQGPLIDRVDPLVHLHFLDHQRESISNPLKFTLSAYHGYKLLTDTIEKNHINVLQTHLPDPNLWGLSIAIFKGCQVFPTIHSNLFFGSDKQIWVSKHLRRLAYQTMFRKCAGVIMCSSEVRESIRNSFHCPPEITRRFHVVENGVPPAEDLPLDERTLIRQKWEVHPQDFFILAGGRYVDAKNFGCLVDAIDVLRGKGLRPKLVIGGDGPQYDTISQQVSNLGLGDQITLPGNLPDLRQIMQAADCLAMSSVYEGLPLVLLEGMIRGLPIAGTRIKGISEIVSDGENGYLAEPNNPSELAEAIAKLMKDPTRSRQLGLNGRKLVEQKYSFSRVYNQVMDVISYKPSY